MRRSLRQGDWPREIRRRHVPARHAGRQDPAQPAPARTHQVDRHLGGREAAGSEGGDLPRRLPRYQGRQRGRRHDPQRHGAGEGPLRWPPGGRRRGDVGVDRQGRDQEVANQPKLNREFQPVDVGMLPKQVSALVCLRVGPDVFGKEKAEAAAAAERKSQVRTVDRSERIRTYNFPENRLSDHRVNYKSNNLDAVLNGDMDEVIQSLLDADKAEKLAAESK